ncbi:MAG: RapZ C-terminal domain-containing protein [Candidatus Dormibacteria bacterium]
MTGSRILLFGPPGAGVPLALEALRRAGLDVVASEGQIASDPLLEEAVAQDRKAWLVGLEGADLSCLGRRDAAWSATSLPDHLDSALFALASARERLLPARLRADLLLDTGQLSALELRARLGQLRPQLWGGDATPVLESFAYTRGVPLDLDWCLDARGLRNPYWEPELRLRSGLDPEVEGFVLGQAQAQGLLEQAQAAVATWLPELRRGGRRRALRLAIGCTGGFHRSVALVEELGRRLRRDSLPHLVWHRDLPGPD